MRLWPILLCLFVGPAAADDPPIQLPPDFSVAYDVNKGFVKIGEATRTFERRGDEFYYESKSWTTGIIAWLLDEDLRDQSWFVTKNQHLAPLRYRHRRDGRKDRRIVQTYDWEAMLAISRYNDETFEIPLVSGAVDQNMYQFSLMMDLKRGQRNMDYQIVEGKEIETYPIRTIGSERHETALGTFDTIVVRRKDKENATTMWCAKKLNYLPVRIEHVEDGVTFNATIQRLEGMGFTEPLTPDKHPADEFL